MNPRENVMALLRREPYEWVPVDLQLCPSLEEEYRRRTGAAVSYQDSVSYTHLDVYKRQ